MSLREIIELWATECDIELTNGEASLLIKLVEENGSSHNTARDEICPHYQRVLYVDVCTCAGKLLPVAKTLQ